MTRTRPTHTLLALLGALMLVANSAPAQDRPVITFTCSLSPDIPAARTLERYYAEAFDALGYDFTMRVRPNKRALVEARAGQSDGECARAIGSLDDSEREDLILLDVILGASTINVWSRQQTPVRATDLQDPTLTIGYSEGARFTRAVLDKIASANPRRAPQLFPVSSDQTAVRMLAFDRLDYVVGTQVMLEEAARVTNLKGQLHNVGELATLEAHPVLHRRHQSLAEPLNRKLQAIVAREGIIQPR